MSVAPLPERVRQWHLARGRQTVPLSDRFGGAGKLAVSGARCRCLCLCLCPVPSLPCRPFCSIRLRNVGTPARIPGNDASDASRIHRRRPHRSPHTSGKWPLQIHCPWPCSWPPSGKFARSRCPMRCSAPSSSRLALAGRTLRSGRRHLHIRYMLRYRIETVGVPWFSPWNPLYVDFP